MQPTIPPMDLSIVIAAHNEQESIADVVRQCRAVLGPEPEIWVIDDGSRDATADVAREAGAQVLRLATNQGKGRALAAGFALTTGQWVATLDGDGQDLPVDLLRLLAAKRDDVGLVIGSRFKGKLEKGAITPLNLLGNLALTGLFDVLYGCAVSDTQAGLRLLRGELARGIVWHSREYEIETEVLAKVLRRGWRVVEVPVTRLPRLGGHTDFRRVHNGMRILQTMLAIRIQRR